MDARILAVVAVIVVLGGFAVFYSYAAVPVTPTVDDGSDRSEAGAVEKKPSAALEAAREIQTFIDSRATQDGFYKYSYNCENGLETNCGLDEVYPTTNVWTSYSNLWLYRATGDASYLEKSRRDADRLIEWCGGSDLSRKMCLYVLVQIHDLYEETGDESYREFLLSQGRLLMDIKYDEDPLVLDQRNSTMMRGIEARELALIYRMNGDLAYVEEAKERALDAYGGLTPDNYVMYFFNGNGYKYNSCWVELANVEIYRATGDASYLNQARDLLDTFDPATNVFYMNFLTNLQSCNELYMEVYKETKNASYIESAMKMSDYVLENRWDSEEKRLVSGSGTILSDAYSKVDTLTDVAYQVRLLSDAANWEEQV